MKLYTVDDGDGAPIAYATKGEAVKEGRALAATTWHEKHVTVEEMTLVPITKAVIVRLVNVSGGYVEAMRTVEVFKGKETDPERYARRR